MILKKYCAQVVIAVLLITSMVMGFSTTVPTKTVNAAAACVGANCVNIDSGTVYQTMTGWEATAQAGQNEFPTEFDQYDDALFDLAVDDLGINRLRIEVYSGMENTVDYYAQYVAGTITTNQFYSSLYNIVNDNGDANSMNASGFQFSYLDSQMDQLALPLKQRLEANGETLYININYVDFGSSAFEHKSNPTEYAEYVLAMYQHMEDSYGITPDSWEVILEPDTASASWSTAQVGNAIKSAGDRLVAAAFTPSFAAPSVTDAANAVSYIDAIAGVSGAMAYVDTFSYHLYGVQDSGTIQGIAARATTYSKNTAMLEYIGADYNKLQRDLVDGNVSAWQQYTLLYPDEPDNGAQYYTLDSSDVNSLAMGSRTKLLRQYFKYIRMGAERVATTNTGNPFIDPVAFINTDGKYVMVSPVSSTTSFGVNNLPAGTYGIYYTTTGGTTTNASNQTIADGESVSLSNIPAGVVTVYNISLAGGDTTGPTFTVNNSVAAGPVQSDTINITVSDATAVSSVEYGYSADSTCNVSDTYGNSFTSNSDFAITGNHTDYLCVKGTDTLANISYQLVGQLNTDNTAPVRSAGLPSGAQASGTTSVNLTLTTSETATCKYGTVALTAYASIASTFSTTNSTSHSTNITGLSDGNSYTYYVRCQDVATNANTDDYTISFSVSSPAPDTTDPTVSITAPADTATVSGASVSVTADAADNVGVVGVQFKLDGSNLGSEDTTSTYGITWDSTSASNGSHTLTAVARDAAGNTKTSDPIVVTVDNAAPTFTVNNSVAAGPTQSDTINVTVTDASSISSSEYGYSSDNTCNGSDTYGNSFTTNVNFSITGNHTDYLCVKATDSQGNIGYQLVGQLNTDNTAPVRSAGLPSGAQASGTTSVNLTLTTNETATCKYGTVASTAYASIASTFSSTNSTSHSNTIAVSDGNSYTYYVRCQDSATNANTDDYTISFSVASAGPDTTDPTVSITAPADSATVSGASVSVTADSADNVGVVGVQFKLDGANLGSEDTTSTYGITWDTTGLSNGTYTLTAVARDAAGNTKTSDPIDVTVDNSLPVVEDPEFSPDGGSFTGTQSVTITTATSGATIRYTTDGSTPTSSVGTIYTDPFDVSATTTVKAIAYKASSTDSSVVSVTFTKNSSSGGGGGGGGGSSGGGNSGGGITPVSPPGPTTSNSGLVNVGGTFYLLVGGVRKGVTSPGILHSCGFEFKDAIAGTATTLTIPSAMLLPCDGALVKSAVDPTVYLISNGKRYGFVSAAVFANLGFKFSTVLLVTDPELQALPKADNLATPSAPHLPGTDININGTIYWIGLDMTKHAYPSIEVYNSWHKDGDFSTVVPANAADLNLITGAVATSRTF